MADKYIMLDIADSRTGKIAEALGNQTSKKILGLLAEKEMNESELSGVLKIPLNTVDYNVKKLVEAGLVEEAKGFLWSTRGKRIKSYRVVNKKIIISPKSSFKGILPAVVVCALAAFGIKVYSDSVGSGVEFIGSETSAGFAESTQIFAKASAPAMDVGTQVASNVGSVAPLASNAPLWFLLGGLFALLIFVVWNMIKSERGFS